MSAPDPLAASRTALAEGEALLAAYELASEPLLRKAVDLAELAVAADPSPEARAAELAALRGLARFCAWMCPWEERVAVCRRALARAEAFAGADALLARACADLGDALVGWSEPEAGEGEALLRRAFELAGAADDRALLAEIGIQVAELDRTGGSEALRVLLRTLEATPRGVDRKRAEVLMKLGDLARERDADEAERWYREAIEAGSERINLDRDDVDWEYEHCLPALSSAELRIGEIHARRGDAAGHEAWLRRALAVEEEHGGYALGDVRDVLGSLLRRRGAVDEAEALFAEGRAALRRALAPGGIDAAHEVFGHKLLVWTWSSGALTDLESDDPAANGLLGERVFGPREDTGGLSPRVRRHRFGHVELAATVLYPWARDRVAAALGLSLDEVERMLSGERAVAIDGLSGGVPFEVVSPEDPRALAGHTGIEAVHTALVMALVPDRLFFDALPIPPPEDDRLSPAGSIASSPALREAFRAVFRASAPLLGAPPGPERSALAYRLQRAVDALFGLYA